MRHEDVEVRGIIVAETDGGGLLFKPDNSPQVWLPRSQVGIVHEVVGVTIVIPYGLARSKGLVPYNEEEL